LDFWEPDLQRRFWRIHIGFFAQQALLFLFFVCFAEAWNSRSEEQWRMVSQIRFPRTPSSILHLMRRHLMPVEQINFSGTECHPPRMQKINGASNVKPPGQIKVSAKSHFIPFISPGQQSDGRQCKCPHLLAHLLTHKLQAKTRVLCFNFILCQCCVDV